MKIFLILIVSIFFRFLYLGVIPVSLAHDEIDNIIQAQSVIHTGKDISGLWSPFQLLPTPTLMGELAPLINVPALAILPQSVFSSHATSALLSALYPLLLLILLMKLGISRKVALISAALLAVSPWHIIFSRTSLEQPVSLFLYTSSWIFLTQIFEPKIKLKSLIISSIMFAIFYGLGFFTYHGFKFSMPILTGVIALYLAYFQNKIIPWKKLLLVIGYIGLLYTQVLLHSGNYSQRANELIFKDTTRFSQQIDFERRVSLAPESIKPIFSNKYISLGQAIIDKYLFTISPDLLFQHGENNGAFSLWTIGYFYLFSLPIILIGFMSMFRTRRKEQMLLLTLFFISPLASIIHTNNSYAFRSAIYFVFLNVILAYGFLELIGYINNRLSKYSKIIYLVISGITILSITHFAYLYYFVSPVNNSNSYFFGERLLTSYVRRLPDTKVLVIDPQPRYVYSSYILGSEKVTKKDIESYNHQYSSTEQDMYNYNNITVMRNCPDDISSYDTIIVARLTLEDSTGCTSIRTKLQDPIVPVSQFVTIKDSGVDRYIISDKLCNGIELKKYVRPTSLKDFDLSNLDNYNFCMTWVVKQ